MLTEPSRHPPARVPQHRPTAEAGSGKSHLTGLLVERWITAGYTVLVVDPEGDHTSLGRLHHTIVIDATAPPSTDQLLQMLRAQSLSVVLDLSGLDASEPRPTCRPWPARSR